MVDTSKLEPLLRPVECTSLEAVPVSTYVNDPRNEGERCIEPDWSSASQALTGCDKGLSAKFSLLTCAIADAAIVK
jgi:hypothetical protein